MEKKPVEICWNELLAFDVETSKAFYGELLGWTASPMKMGDMEYVIFTSGDKEVAGLYKMEECGSECGCEHKLSRWIPYMSVTDVDATVKKAKELGGEVLFGPIDVPNVGRIAVLADQSGAKFGLVTNTKK